MPTVLRIGSFRFFFFSNEGQELAHIHVKAGDDEATFWLDPVQLVANYGFNGRQLRRIQRLVEEHRDELLESWNEHFSA
jgi:chitinase